MFCSSESVLVLHPSLITGIYASFEKRTLVDGVDLCEKYPNVLPPGDNRLQRFPHFSCDLEGPMLQIDR